MAAYLKAFSDFFWADWFWCPKGKTWADMIPEDPNIRYPQFSDMHLSILLGFGLLILRYVYESCLVVPVARYLGVKEKKKPLEPNAKLDAAFRKYRGKVPDHEIKTLKKQTDLSEQQIQRWFYRRRLWDAPTAMQRFRECSWHFLFYTTSFVYGVYTLWDKPWLWQSELCWKGWPNLHVTFDIYLFYVVELGFYWSLVFTLMIDHARKDFWEMTIHHFVTIVLMYFSWATNFIRIGTLVLIVHDVADTWMASAKMAKYSKHQTICEVLFAIFIFIWTVSRIGVYPYWVLNSSLLESYPYTTGFPAWWMFNILLVVLQILHVIWTIMIYRVAFQKFTHGSLQKDVRSDTEESDDENSEEDERVKTQVSMNGSAYIRTNRNHNTNMTS